MNPSIQEKLDRLQNATRENLAQIEELNQKTEIHRHELRFLLKDKAKHEKLALIAKRIAEVQLEISRIKDAKDKLDEEQVELVQHIQLIEMSLSNNTAFAEEIFEELDAEYEQLLWFQSPVLEKYIHECEWCSMSNEDELASRLHLEVTRQRMRSEAQIQQVKSLRQLLRQRSDELMTETAYMQQLQRLYPTLGLVEGCTR